MPTMPFGRHRGVELTEVPLPYLEWLLRERIIRQLWLETEVRCEVLRRWAEVDRQQPAAPTTDLAGAVRRWFGGMALKYHPDRGGSDDAMRVINDAHEDLKRELGL